MIKCLIIDDEPLAIRLIESHLRNVEGFEISKTFDNGIEACDFLQEHQDIDLIFLDINMPKLSGLEMLKLLESPPFVIITTAYQEFAIESFEYNVIDYLIKPIAFPRFLKSVNKAKKLFNLDQKSRETLSSLSEPHVEEFIFLKVDKKYIKVYLDEILYIESLKDYVRVYTKENNYVTHLNLNKITEALPSDRFVRIHRSYTISINQVKAVDGNSVEIGKSSLPIGRNFLKDAREKIFNLGIYKAD